MNARNPSDKYPKHACLPAEDEVLWESFKGGDREAFSEIYYRYIHVLYFYGINISGNAALTEDCIQDLFIYLWDNRERLGKTDNIKYYLFTSLRRKILLDVKKDRKTKLQEPGSLPQAADLSYEHTLIFNQTKSEEKAMLNRAVLSLTKRQQEAIRLRFYDNLSFKEVADSMSLSIKATYNLISRALHILRGNIHCLPACLWLVFLG